MLCDDAKMILGKSDAYLLMLSCAWVLCVPLQAHSQNPATEPSDAANQILKRADEVRFPNTGFEVNVRIRTLQSGALRDERGLRVLSKGNSNTLVMTTEPAAERGQILLMKERDLWLYLPSVSQPVRLSLAQRLLGQVSYGDIARANFSGDYTPQLAGTERLEGDELYVLELKALDKGVTYQRVRYWVRKSNYWPYKAEFYSLSGRLLKTCAYDGFRELGGQTRPTRLIMTDALRQGEQSILEYGGMRFRDLPDRVFTKEYLRRLE